MILCLKSVEEKTFNAMCNKMISFKLGKFVDYGSSHRITPYTHHTGFNTHDHIAPDRGAVGRDVVLHDHQALLYAVQNITGKTVLDIIRFHQINDIPIKLLSKGREAVR